MLQEECLECNKKYLKTEVNETFKKLLVELEIIDEFFIHVCPECQLKLFNSRTYTKKDFTCKFCKEEFNISDNFFLSHNIYICSNCQEHLKISIKDEVKKQDYTV